MATYESFARVYDLFMDNIPYEEWSVYLHELLQRGGVEDGLVLELGCGVRCVLGLVMDPYGSYRFVYAALAACWLLNILCLV